MLEIIQIKKVKATNVSDAKRIIRKQYPRSFIVSYRFEEDYKFVHKDDRKYKDRTMKIAFIEDMRKIRDVLIDGEQKSIK